MSPLLQTPLTIEYALLGFMHDEALHGYEINRRLSETHELRLVWRVKQSRLYALLSRLEDEGLLAATLEPQDGRPPRKVYHLTAAGRRAYDRWLTQPVQLPREMRLEFMLKLYFSLQEGPQTATWLIERQLEVCDRWLATQAGSETPGTFARAVRRYRRGHIEAIREWLARLPAELIGERDPAS